jgi:hypothetical protein
MAMCLAFTVGATVTYLDCYSTLANRVGRVAGSFVANPAILALCAACGLIAASVCWATSGEQANAVSRVLTLTAPDPWRGVAVGLSVLVLIRSKIANLGEKNLGLDYAYDLARDLAIQNVNNRWTVTRSTFQTRNMGAALADPQFEAKLTALITITITAQPPASQAHVQSTLASVTAKRPAQAFSATDPVWQMYYRTLIGLDACGPGVIRAMSGFVWP